MHPLLTLHPLGRPRVDLLEECSEKETGHRASLSGPTLVAPFLVHSLLQSSCFWKLNLEYACNKMVMPE